MRMKVEILKDDLRNLRLLEEAEAYRNEGYVELRLVDFKSNCGGKDHAYGGKREKQRSCQEHTELWSSINSLLAFCISPGKMTSCFVKSVTVLGFKKIFV